MPKFSVRFYHSYVDDFEVEAETPQQAIELADAWKVNTPQVKKVTDHEFVGVEDTRVDEIDPETGQYVEVDY
jgi:hypothetical protein